MKWIIPILAFFLFANPILAQETGVINAGILPGLWYSQTQISAGDDIKIFGGFHNHSTTTIERQVAFIVDGVPISTKSFTSKPDTLIELEAGWQAVSGKHTLVLRITSASQNLLTTTSSEVELSVKRVITTETLKTNAVDVATGIVESLDSAAESLSAKILDLKKIETVQTSVVVGSDGTFSVSTSTASTTSNNLDSEGQTRSAYNLALTFLASTVLHWKLTLAAILALVLLVKFTS